MMAGRHTGAEPLLATATPAAAPLDEATRARRVAAMFDEHYDAMWRTLRRLGVSDADVDDAAQRVFVIANRRLETIAPGHEGRYLYGIAVRLASEVRRRDPRRRETSDTSVLAAIADDAPGPEEALLEHEARDALDATLAAMPDDLRVVLVLVELEGLSVSELAGTLDVPIGTASSRLRRAREAFTASARRIRARLDFGGQGDER
jgi:RNA polymerase sigma-70 factor (ECF subfamily)